MIADDEHGDGEHRDGVSFGDEEQDERGEPAEDDDGCSEVHGEEEDGVPLFAAGEAAGADEVGPIVVEALGVAGDPAAELATADAPILGDLFVALGAVDVGGAPAVEEEGEGDVGVFGERFGVPSADGAESGCADAADGAAELGGEAEVVAGLLDGLIAGGALEGEEAGEEAVADVVGDDAAHDGTDFGVKEGRGEHFEDGATGDIVGVEHEVDFAGGVDGGFDEGGWFAAGAFGSMVGLDEGVTAGEIVDDGAGRVGGAVIDGDDFEEFPVVVAIDDSLEDVAGDTLFVVHGDEDGDAGHDKADEFVSFARMGDAQARVGEIVVADGVG